MRTGEIFSDEVTLTTLRNTGIHVKTRTLLKELSFRAFKALDRLGIHVLPKHYYTPIADYAWLQRNPSFWQRPLSMSDVEWNLDGQFRWLAETCEDWYAEALERAAHNVIGPGFGRIETRVLHCFVRKYAPARVIEVGSGTSTATMAAAAELNVQDGRNPTRITTIDPFPSSDLHRFRDVELRREYCQTLGIAPFEELNPGDLLFIDSTHTVKTGSEVPWLYLEVLPALSKGVYVHAHDIFLPYLYRPTILDEYFDWQETALLAALLIGNKSLRVLCCQAALHQANAVSLKSILPDYQPKELHHGLAKSNAPGDYPASIWMIRS